jgi:hypothetical protein
MRVDDRVWVGLVSQPWVIAPAKFACHVRIMHLFSRPFPSHTLYVLCLSDGHDGSTSPPSDGCIVDLAIRGDK